MNNFKTHNEFRNTLALAPRTFLVFIFVLVCGGMFAQNEQSPNPTEDLLVVSSEKAVAVTNTQMELLYWFMGSKHGKAGLITDDRTTSQKKQFINAGLTPNRILSRTFMNKAINYESTLS